MSKFTANGFLQHCRSALNLACGTSDEAVRAAGLDCLKTKFQLISGSCNLFGLPLPHKQLAAIHSVSCLEAYLTQAAEEAAKPAQKGNPLEELLGMTLATAKLPPNLRIVFNPGRSGIKRVLVE